MKKILTNERIIHAVYVKELAIKIINRLSELRAANSLADIPEVPPPRRHKLMGNYAGCWSIMLSVNYRLIISPTGIYDYEDITSITEISIVDIVDYH